MGAHVSKCCDSTSPSVSPPENFPVPQGLCTGRELGSLWGTGAAAAVSQGWGGRGCSLPGSAAAPCPQDKPRGRWCRCAAGVLDKGSAIAACCSDPSGRASPLRGVPCKVINGQNWGSSAPSHSHSPSPLHHPAEEGRVSQGACPSPKPVQAESPRSSGCAGGELIAAPAIRLICSTMKRAGYFLYLKGFPLAPPFSMVLSGPAPGISPFPTSCPATGSFPDPDAAAQVGSAGSACPMLAAGYRRHRQL